MAPAPASYLASQILIQRRFQMAGYQLQVRWSNAAENRFRRKKCEARNDWQGLARIAERRRRGQDLRFIAFPVIFIYSSVVSGQESIARDRTFETWVPRDRCAPEHSRQRVMPKFKEAHSAGESHSQHVAPSPARRLIPRPIRLPTPSPC